MPKHLKAKHTSNANHIALVGCGFTGTSAFFQLVQRFPVKKVYIFEASGDFGPGYAYKTDECPDYLINNTSNTMCLEPSNRSAFFDWLTMQPDYGSDTDPQGHLPRVLYGRFLKDMLAATQAQAANKGIKVEFIPFEATDIQESSDGKVTIGWAHGRVTVDAAILTTGRCPGVDAYAHPPTDSRAKYIAEHIVNDELDDIPLEAAIHVLGASLSAYDVINRMFSAKTGCGFERDSDGSLVFKPGPNNRTLALVSRSGRMKHMQSQNPSEIKRRYFTTENLQGTTGQQHANLAEVAEAIRQEAKAHEDALDWATLAEPYGSCTSQADVDAQAVILLEKAITSAKGDSNFLVDLFQDAQTEIWDAFANHMLDVDSEQNYRSQYETAALSFVAPCPVPTAERLLALLRAGRVSIIKGVSDVQLDASGDFYKISHQYGVERAGVLINTTGAVDTNVNSPAQPEIIKSLYNAGLLTAYQREGREMKGANVDLKTFRLPATQHIYLANMLLWGPGFFTSSAHLMATIVERILEGIYDST